MKMKDQMLDATVEAKLDSEERQKRNTIEYRSPDMQQGRPMLYHKSRKSEILRSLHQIHAAKYQHCSNSHYKRVPTRVLTS
jgi:hypothetical protein